jgi:hypothetical protein
MRYPRLAPKLVLEPSGESRWRRHGTVSERGNDVVSVAANTGLEGRVARLEGEVTALRAALRLQGYDPDHGVSGERRAPAGAGLSPETGKTSRLPFGLGDLGVARGLEWWLGRIGVGLLFLGVVFLFAYSIERGWIGPAVRVGAGIALGSALLVAGLRVRRRPALAGALLGGSVGVFYASVFAAYQLYELVPHVVAFALMVAVTFLSFALSLHRDDATPSLVGTLGGLGTPFLLYDGDGSLPGLMLYTCLVLTGAAAVYLYKGWVPLLAVAFAGGWTVFGASYATNLLSTHPAVGDRLSLQAGVAVAWLLFACAPVARVLILGPNSVPAFVVPVFAFLAPLVALGFTGAAWQLPLPGLGRVAICGAGLYALAALALRGSRRPRATTQVRTHALVALLLASLAGVLILRGDALLLALAAEAAVLHLASRRLSDRVLFWAAHLLSVSVASWLGSRLVVGLLTGGVPLGASATDLAALALLFVASFALRNALRDAPRDALVQSYKKAYRLLAHLGLLLWLWRELSSPFGDASVTASWGLYAAGLLVAGLLSGRVRLARWGTATLLLVVGKLFLVDLAAVGAGPRVLLFLGFGALFLILSYYTRSLWRSERQEDHARVPGDREGLA